MSYPTYRVLLVGLVVLFTAAVTYVTALQPSTSTSRLGMRGLKRQQSLLRHPLWSSVEPVVRWLSARVGPLVSPLLRSRLEAQLTYAGDFMGMSAHEYVACGLATAAFGGAVGAVALVVLDGPIGVVLVLVCAGIGAALPWVVIDGVRVRRFRQVNRGLPYAIDMMALSMSAGLDFSSAVEQVVEKSRANEALREELGYFLQQLRLGVTRAEALEELARRVPIECVREFSQALTQAEERGNPVSDVLEVQAVTARTRRSNTAEKAAKAMKSRMILPTVILSGVGLALIAVPTTMMIDRMSHGPMDLQKSVGVDRPSVQP